jgi:hypothetical protein
MQYLNAEETARQLVQIGVTSTDYANGVQAERERRLKTFTEMNVPILIEHEQSLIAYGKEVIELMKQLETNNT